MPAKKGTSNPLTLLCTPRALIASYMYQQSPTNLRLSYYKKIPLHHLELEKLILFNPTRIARLISNLMADTKNRSLFISLDGPAIQDQCINLPTAQPKFEQLPISHAPHWQWDCCYLYPHDYAYYYYLCGIPKELILQLQLLAIQEDWNLHYLTSERMALLQLYKFRFGKAYRPSQLGIDLYQKNNTIEALFTPDDLSRILSIPSDITIDEEDIHPLLVSAGLYIAGEQYA